MILMKYLLLILLPALMIACRDEKEPSLTAQEIVDRAIVVAGGEHIEKSTIRFVFRDREYVRFRKDGQRILQRITPTDTARVTDTKAGDDFERKVDGSLIPLPDSTSHKLANSVNSVHYFAYLPNGLNDRAVNKELLGRTRIGEADYYKIRVTFDREGGGDDYQDVFVYWFNAKTFRPDYLAYTYHTDGGGQRFRVAYNDREVGGLRFQDYRNYKPSREVEVTTLDSLYAAGELELLSDIELEDIRVIPGNYK